MDIGEAARIAFDSPFEAKSRYMTAAVNSPLDAAVAMYRLRELVALTAAVARVDCRNRAR